MLSWVKKSKSWLFDLAGNCCWVLFGSTVARRNTCWTIATKHCSKLKWCVTKHGITAFLQLLADVPQAFKPGIVDMTEDQLAVNRNAITLQENNLDLDAFLPGVDWFALHCLASA